MSLIAANIEKLKDFTISKRDRTLLYWAIGGNAALIVALVGTIAAFGWFGKDAKTLAALADTMMWVEFALIVVFVGGSLETRRVAARTMTPPAAPPSATATAAAPREKK